MKIGLACDHAGFEYKEKLKEYLSSKNIEISDFGCYSEESVDYPDLIHPVAEDVSNGKSSLGVIICGSGNGAAMTANKHQKVRAALCWNKETVNLARLHNNANILSIPARFITIPEALSMVKIFIETKFEGGRHQARIDKIPCN